MFFLPYISLFLIIIIVLINVAFLTLMERKILSLVQLRHGPNKVSFFGITQPFADAIKLFIKENCQPYLSNFKMYYISPLISLFLALWLWNLWNMYSNSFYISLSILLLLLIMSLSIFPLLFSGWASNNKYSLLGSLRGIAQTISYEISFAIFIFILFIMLNELDLQNYNWMNNFFHFLFFFPLLFFFWFLSCIAETNRTPFDFAEGESELVSGFNTEYSGGGFAFIFMSEYASILFFSMLTCYLFMKYSFLSVFMITFIMFIWVWIRSTYPRYRYDKLMNLAWKMLLPWSLNLIFFFISIMLF